MAKTMGDNVIDEKPYQVFITEQPVTEQRVPWVRKRSDPLDDAGTARANIAASNEKPNGTEENHYTKRRSNQTVSPAQHSLLMIEWCLTDSRFSSSTSITGTKTKMG